MPGHFSGPGYAPDAAYCGRFKILGALDRKRRNSAVCSCRVKRGDGAREDEQFRARHVNWSGASDAKNRRIYAAPLSEKRGSSGRPNQGRTWLP
jgi:hypothetical protein